MRILHIFDHSLPFHSGYVFRSLSLLTEQRKLGWETHHLTNPKHHLLVASGYGKATWKSPDQYPKEETIDGWHYHRTPPPSGILSRVPGLKAFPIARVTSRRIREVCAQLKPDIIHAHSPFHNGLAALWASRKTGIPFVYEIRAFWEDAHVGLRNDRFGKLEYAFWKSMETHVVRHAAAVFVISEGLRKDLVERGIPDARIFVIPNGVDATKFSRGQPRDEALAAQLGIGDELVLGFAGSFLDYEGLQLLVQALPRIRASLPAVKVLLVGKGPAEPELREKTRELGIEDHVIFTGQVPHADIDRYYSLFDVLVYPRLSMRLTELVTPLKPLEAMAQGKLVLASDVGGHREMIEDGVTGFLFPADSADGLADKVIGIAQQRENWSSVLARAESYINQQRTWQASVANYQEPYRRLTLSRA